MFWIIGWIIFGLIAGMVAKWLHPGEDQTGFLFTVGVGVIGSIIGGVISWLISFGGAGFGPSGLLMSILGGVLFLWAYRKYRLNSFLEAQGRMPNKE